MALYFIHGAFIFWQRAFVQVFLVQESALS
jgi:hypothetical protein